MINPKDKLLIRRQCELIHLNRSDVYYKHTENAKKREYEEELMKHIDELHTEYPCLGSRKLVTLLKGEHFSVGRKLVRRLMQAMGLYVIYPKPNLSKRNFRESIVRVVFKIVDNLVNHAVRFRYYRKGVTNEKKCHTDVILHYNVVSSFQLPEKPIS